MNRLARCPRVCWPGLVLLFVLGCGRAGSVNLERDLEVDPLGGDNIKSIVVPASRSAQKIDVLVRTNAIPVDVYVTLESNLEALQNQLANQQAVTAPVLAKGEKITESQLTASVPAQQAFAVVVVNSGSKKASVSLKIVGSKP
jgi:hypothetical protein